MRVIRSPWPILLLPLVLSCASGDKPCDPSQPCGETYSLQITVRDRDGSPVEGIEVFGMSVPDTPFGPLERQVGRAAAGMEFSLPQSATTQIDIFDIHGNRVRRLVDDQRPPGLHRVVWNTRDDAGMELPGGFYRVVLTAFDTDETVLFTDAQEGFLNGTPVALGKTDAQGQVTSTDMTFFPGLILGNAYEMPLRAADGQLLGTFDLSGGARILLKDAQGLQRWFDVALTVGSNGIDLEYCPTCPVPLEKPGSLFAGNDTVVRPAGPIPEPPGQFSFSGFFPNPFN